MPARAFPTEPSVATGDPTELLERAKEILRGEAQALEALSQTFPASFPAAVERILNCSGCVIVTGIGKAGIVGQKLAASLSSTGTPSHFLHPGEAVHGDLGCVRSQDVVVLLSYSGETEEVVRLLALLNAVATSTIAITAHDESTLARSVDLVVPIGRHPEACSLGLAPSTSTTLMMGLCDALALVVSERRAFSREQFAQFHPGGSLGRQLALVADVMRPKDECRMASQDLSVRDVLVQISRPGRRTGAIMLLDQEHQLKGIFTDSDLARLLEHGQDALLDAPIRELMTTQFHTVLGTSRYEDAVQVMSEYKISELPVVDDKGFPLGIIDITDVVGLSPMASQSSSPKILSLQDYR